MNYLTKRATLRLSYAASLRASGRAMEVAGYILVSENGWLVKISKDGTASKIKRFKNKSKQKLVLD